MTRRRRQTSTAAHKYHWSSRSLCWILIAVALIFVICVFPSPRAVPRVKPRVKQTARGPNLVFFGKIYVGRVNTYLLELFYCRISSLLLKLSNTRAIAAALIVSSTRVLWYLTKHDSDFPSRSSVHRATKPFFEGPPTRFLNIFLHPARRRNARVQQLKRLH